MERDKDIEVFKRTKGDDFLSFNTLYKSEKYKSAGIYYSDIDVIYIKRVENHKNRNFKTIIKTKSKNKLSFGFLDASENDRFHKKVKENYLHYLNEKSIQPYTIHSIISRIDDIEIVETKLKNKRRKVFDQNRYYYESWTGEFIVIKTKFGNKAITTKFHYEEKLNKGIAIGKLADREYYKKTASK